MKLTSVTNSEITIAFSRNELVFINSSILETLEALEEWEFQTRTGETPAFAKEMLAQLRVILDHGQAK